MRYHRVNYARRWALGDVSSEAAGAASMGMVCDRQDKDKEEREAKIGDQLSLRASGRAAAALNKNCWR